MQIFLFTDVLLITKAKKNGEKFRIIRQPYRLNKLVIHPSKDYNSSFILLYLNEYGVLVTAFTLQVASNELTKWMQSIAKAKVRLRMFFFFYYFLIIRPQYTLLCFRMKCY